MPSPQHDAPVLLFREVPALAVRVLRELLHVELPSYRRMVLGPTDFTSLPPVELRPDFVLVLEGEVGPVFGVLIEVQRRIDEDKPLTWLRYHAELAHRLRAPVALVVLALDEAVARWAERPTNYLVGAPYRPLVLSPSRIPWIESVEEATRLGDLSILSALVHENRKNGARVAAAVLEAAQHMEDEARVLYTDLILAALDKRARAQLESIMPSPGYQWQSDLAKKWIEQGRQEGRQEGRAAGKAHSVLAVLAARGLPVSEALRSAILACADDATLDRWTARAVSCARAEEVLDG